MAMHFVAAAELAAFDLASLGEVRGLPDDSVWKNRILPHPQSLNMELDDQSKASSMMYGVFDEISRWHMNPVHCRTSFEPTVGGRLEDSIVTGAYDSKVPREYQTENESVLQCLFLRMLHIPRRK